MEKTINEIAGLWREEKKMFVKKATMAAYEQCLSHHLLPAFGTATSLSEEEVQAFALKKMAEGLSRKTVKDMLAVLRMLAHYATKHAGWEYEKWDIKLPGKRETRQIEVLSVAQQRKIMQYVSARFSFQGLGIYICLSTGLRIGEVCALTWADIDTEEKVIRVNKTLERIYIHNGNKKHTELILDRPKTANSNREIPMSNSLLKLVRPLKRILNKEFYVLSNSPSPIEPRTYRNYYKRLLEELGLPHLKFHGLRNTFATRCIESKCDYKTLSVLLGHSNISTTLNLYVHPNLEQKQRCIEQMYKSLRFEK